MNPTAQPQAVTVNILGGRPLTRSFTIPARDALPGQELGSWGLDGDFSVEVLCDTVCSAALTMWDGKYEHAHESKGDEGCRYK